jgi:hypothetical protein
MQSILHAMVEQGGPPEIDFDFVLVVGHFLTRDENIFTFFEARRQRLHRIWSTPHHIPDAATSCHPVAPDPLQAAPLPHTVHAVSHQLFYLAMQIPCWLTGSLYYAPGTGAVHPGHCCTAQHLHPQLNRFESVQCANRHRARRGWRGRWACRRRCMT